MSDLYHIYIYTYFRQNVTLRTYRTVNIGLSRIIMPCVFNCSGKVRIFTCWRQDQWRLHNRRFCDFSPEMELLCTHLEFCQGNFFFLMKQTHEFSKPILWLVSTVNNILKAIVLQIYKKSHSVFSQHSMWLCNTLKYSAWHSSSTTANCVHSLWI
jgi:hypothetical protein